MSGLPAAEGTYNLTIQVGDSTAAKASVALPLVIAPGGMAITTASPLPPATAGTPYSISFAVTGGAPPYTFGLPPNSAVPPGTSIPAGGVLAGVPTTAGVYSFAVTASSTTGQNTPSTAKQFTLTVGPATLSVVTSVLGGGVIDQPYAQSLQAAGGAIPYSWSVPSGPLPPGLLLSITGQIVGTPTQTGTFPIVVQVNDGAGQTATRPLQIAVTATPGPLQFTTTALPPGKAGAGYSFPLGASGGKPGYTFSLVPGSAVPDGLSLLPSGTLTGTPVRAGSYQFNIQVVDTLGSSVRRLFGLGIDPADLVITTRSAAGGERRSALLPGI